MGQLHVLFIQINTYLSGPVGADRRHCLLLNIHESTGHRESHSTGIYGPILTSLCYHNGIAKPGTSLLDRDF